MLAAGAREVPYDLSALLDGDDQDDVADGGRDQAAAVADPVLVVDVPGLVAENLVDVADDSVREARDAGQIRRGRATRCGSPPRSACTRR